MELVRTKQIHTENTRTTYQIDEWLGEDGQLISMINGMFVAALFDDINENAGDVLKQTLTDMLLIGSSI